MEDTRCRSPYLLFVPVEDPEDSEPDTYFVPKHTWRSDVTDAAERLNHRRQLSKGFMDQENMFCIVHTVTQHVDRASKRLTGPNFRAALEDMGILDESLITKILHYMMEQNSGEYVDYYDLMNVLCEYAAGCTLVQDGAQKIERWKLTARGCYELFDPPEVGRGYIAARDLKKMRGKTFGGQGLQGEGVTFAMHKALLDLCSANDITQVINPDQLEAEWMRSPSLVFGFVEEIFRTILVDKHHLRRSCLYKSLA